MLVSCRNTIQHCCNACCHFQLPIGQDQHRGHSTFGLGA
jgi:hypothetical protein